MPPSPRAGVVFTPPELARRLCARLDAGRGAVLDPACGEGALLCAALEARGDDPEFARQGLHGFDTDPRSVERARAALARRAGVSEAELAENVRVADALEPGLEWPVAHVIANPPWVSYSGRQSLGEDRSAVHARGSGGWPSLHGAFLERIARHVAGHAVRAAVLLPAPVTYLAGYARLRRAVEELAGLDGPPEAIDESEFDDVCEPAVLLVLDAARRGRAEWVGRTDDERALLEALRPFPRVPPRTFCDAGVHTGNASKLLVFEEPGAGRAALRIGRDLRPYALAAPARFLRTDLERTAERRFRIGSLERFRSIPVLVRQTADRPLAALHDSPTYFRNSLLGMRAVESLSPEFCVAVLNGVVAGAWHRTAHGDARQRSFPQVKVGHLAELPFPIARADEDPELHAEVTTRVRELDPGNLRARAVLDERLLDAYGLEDDIAALALERARDTRRARHA